MSEFQSVNEGTGNKGKLQDQSITHLPSYPPNQTLKAYAEHLGWDIKVSTRTALESYILPMVRKGYLVHVKGDIYTQASNNPTDKPLNVQYENYVKECITNKTKKLNFEEWNQEKNNQ